MTLTQEDTTAIHAHRIYALSLIWENTKQLLEYADDEDINYVIVHHLGEHEIDFAKKKLNELNLISTPTQTDEAPYALEVKATGIEGFERIVSFNRALTEYSVLTTQEDLILKDIEFYTYHPWKAKLSDLLNRLLGRPQFQIPTKQELLQEVERVYTKAGFGSERFQ